MYVPNINRMDDREAMIAFMRQYNFAIVVSHQENIPVATHLPLTILQRDEQIVLGGHFAKANSQWQSLPEQEVLVIFSGPHAYISPAHYDKFESVPTWNYVTVHAYGRVALFTAQEHPQKLDTLLADLMKVHEPTYQAQWNQLSDKYRDGMKRGIVGVEIGVTALQGKAKLSQNKTNEEQARIGQALLKSQLDHVVEVGLAMVEK